MACTIRDVPVLNCPDQFHPELLKALVAFPTRTTFYLQSMLVAFNAAMGECFELAPYKPMSD